MNGTYTYSKNVNNTLYLRNYVYKYVVQNLHRKQVHVSSVPRHCVHQYINNNWRWDRNSVYTNICPDRPSLTPQAFTGYFLQHQFFCVIHNYDKLFFHFFGQTIFFSSEWSHIHIKCLLKALVFCT